MAEKGKLSEQWDKLSPSTKRVVVIVFVLAVVAFFAAGGDTLFKPKPTEKHSGGDTVRSVLTNQDTRKLGIDALSAQVQKMRREIADLTETVSKNIQEQDTIRRTRNGEVDTELGNLKKELREIKTKGDNFRARVESGSYGRNRDTEKTTTTPKEKKSATEKDDKSATTTTTKDGKTVTTRERVVKDKDGKTRVVREKVVTEKKPKKRTYFGGALVEEDDNEGISDTSELFSSLGRTPEPLNGDTSTTSGGESGTSGTSGMSQYTQDPGLDIPEPPLKISVINAAPKPEEIKAKLDKKNKKDKDKDIEFYMPTGSILSAMLLNGIDASTSTGAKQEPMPALLRVNKDAILPNRYSSDIKDCFVLVSGHGDLSSERAYLRGEYLSCVRNDGGILETKFPSYVVGEDGKAGMKGRLVSKQGTLIARTLVAGFASGVSKAFDVTPVSVLDTTSIGGSVQYQNNFNSGLMRGAAAQGASQALEKVADFYLKMAEQIFPVVEITAGRQVNIIVTNGTKLTLKNVNELDGDHSSTPTSTSNVAISPAATAGRTYGNLGGK